MSEENQEKAGKKLADRIEKYLNRHKGFEPRDGEFLNTGRMKHKKLAEFVNETAAVLEENGSDKTDLRLVESARKMENFSEVAFNHTNSVAYAFKGGIEEGKKKISTNPFKKSNL